MERGRDYLYFAGRLPPVPRRQPGEFCLVGWGVHIANASHCENAGPVVISTFFRGASGTLGCVVRNIGVVY